MRNNKREFNINTSTGTYLIAQRNLSSKTTALTNNLNTHMFSKDISSVNKTQFKYVCIYSGVWKNRSAFVAVKNFYNKSHLNNLENFSAQNTLKCLLKWARQWSEHSWHTLCFSNKPRKNNRTTQIWISGWLIKERSFWHQMSKEFFAEILLLDS